ncbi:MAG: hypothetical protein EXS37_20415 [Opitutus sp.]|nr:hypothetical protein [Opitutus sp.]
MHLIRGNAPLMKRRFASLFATCVTTAAAYGQINYAGGGYLQNFDTLNAGTTGAPAIAWTDNVTLPGWYADRSSYAASSGLAGGTAAAFDDPAVAANAGLFSFGAAGATDRALGSRAAGAPVRFGVRLVNQTGQTLTRFAVAFNGEQWFKSSATTAHALTADYQLGATGLAAGTWTNVPVLTFTSPIIAPAAPAALNGNLAANRVSRVATVTGISWAPGQELWIRFTDTDEAGAEHGLAVDDFAFWTGEETGLFFNGVNSYVTMGPAPALGLSVFTVECWFLRTGAGATTNTGTGGVTGVPLVAKGRGEADGSNVDCNYFLGLDAAGRLVADFEAAPAPNITAGQNYPITGNAVVPVGVWNHAAVTYDGTTWRLYLNGELDATTINPVGASPRADSIQHFGIGTAMTSTGAAAGFFEGMIDEVRVWHVVRSAAEILGARDLPVTGAASGLVARYALGEGTGTTIAGQVAGAPAGTLTGGPAWALGHRLVANLPPTVVLASPTAAYRGTFPATVPFAATVADPDGVVVKVEFYTGSIKVGESTRAPFTFDWPLVAAGTYTLIAAATDNSGARTTSTPVTITVSGNANRPATIALNSPAAAASSIAGSTALTVTVADPERAATQVTFYGRKTTPAIPGPDFTIGTLPDTQFYSEDLNSRAAYYFGQTQWYADNRDALNLAFVSHMGDIVEHGDVNSTTLASNEPEWLRADAAMKTLENQALTLRAHGIPWGAAPGNHDQSPNGDAGGTTSFYNQYFGVSRFAGRSYYAGHYGTNNNNNYQLFSVSGLDFVILHLEYDIRALSFYQPVLEWADAVLKLHANRRAIVTSHWIVNTGNPATFSPQGRAIYDALKSNPNLFLMLCGHVAGEGRRADVFEGRTVYSLLQDYQGRVNGGDGWLRYFVFSPARNAIMARSYSPALNRAELDDDSDFTLPYDMQSAVTEWIPLGTVNVPAGGTTATLDWTGLERGSHYEWYASVRDEINTTTAAARRFATVVPIPPTVALTAPATGARIAIPATLRLTASASDADGTVTKVEFFHGNTKLGEDTSAPYEFTWAGVATGDYALSAVATDNTGATALSRTVNLTVFNANNQAPTVALTSPAANTRVTAPASLSVTATAADTDGKIVKVEFFAGSTKLGESTAAPPGINWAPPAIGSYTLTAVATDNDGGVTTSAPIVVTMLNPVVAALVPRNATWKYLDNGSDQGTAWRAPGFDDSAWPSGAAELGYGDGDETTVVGFGPNPASRSVTTYFRRTFTVADPTRVGRLVLNLVRDDGAIVYLNGTEIGRSAMTAGTNYLFNTLAPTAVDGADESTFFPLVFSTNPAPLLVRGANTVAVEVHQQAIANSDLSFNLELLDHRVPAGTPPTVALTAPAAGTTFTTPAIVSLAANAADADGTIARVEFIQNDQKIGESTTAPHGVTWSNPAAGSYVLTAVATDNDGNFIASSPVSITVREGNPGRFINFSILSNVSSGTGTLIVGFVTGGAGTVGTKPLLLRAIGPALAAFGVTGFLADPAAALFAGAASVATNDNWAGNAQVVSTGLQVGAFPLVDPASLDAALIATRANGSHSFQVSGAGGRALAEIYDATPGAGYSPTTPRLVNVSARVLVGTGNDVLTAGLVVGGATERRVLIRAIGPSLTALGVANAMADPRLDLFVAGSSTAMAGNEDWGGTAVLATAFARVGAFTLTPTSRDAALLVTLAPGIYTVRLSGPAGATGVALIDIYEVP